MTSAWIGACSALLTLSALAVEARPLKLEPADPQPTGLTEGLAVEYAYPSDVKTLRDAYIALGIGAEPGQPLSGLNYSSGPGTPDALTSGQELHVAARITGFVRFEAAGVHVLEFLTNDGLELTLGGEEIVKVDARRPCDPTGQVEVSVPEAGWYELEALWFQRQGMSCLIMQWAPEGGRPDVAPAAAFGYE